jgi:protein involved in polysaccharide export with SLBB domain
MQIIATAALASSLLTPAAGAEIPAEIKARLLGMAPLETKTRQPVHTGTVRIDNSLDPDRYFIGMGDIFDISVVEMPSISYEAEVNQNCDIVVSELGILELGKRSLREAKTALQEFVEQKLRRRNTVYVSLVAGKTVNVAVAGAVENPGTYNLNGTLRVLDAIRKANNDELPDLNEHDYRSVECRSGDSVAYLDLYQYIFGGVDSANPYLYPGDHITLNTAVRTALVLGAVRFPLEPEVPIREGETVGELLSLFPLQESADSNSIVIVSGALERERNKRVVSLEQADTVPVRDMDVITVSSKADYARLSAATTRGEVLRPGSYPIRPGVTTAGELLELSGGPTDQANLDRAVIVRHSKMVSRTLKEGVTLSGVDEPPDIEVGIVRPEISASFQKLNLINDYLLIPLAGNRMDTKLLNEDHIIVPRTETHVYVSGNVRAPGAYPYVPGKGRRYYVRQAGGYTNKAARANAYAFAQHGPAVMIKPTRNIDEGDVLVIPDVEEHKFLRTLFLPILQAVATSIAAVVALITVAR